MASRHRLSASPTPAAVPIGGLSAGRFATPRGDQGCGGQVEPSGRDVGEVLVDLRVGGDATGDQPVPNLANRRGLQHRAGRGGDRKEPVRLDVDQAGLVDVEADGFFPVTSPACAVLETATVRQVRDRLVAGGIATDAEIDEHLANVAAGGLDLATAPLISAWGR